MTITVRRADDPTVFDTVPCYKPIKGGTRHLTTYDEKPLNGTVIQFWCELKYVVGSQRRSPYIYDCSCCLETYLAAHGEPTGEPQ
jgi:hypothetical protein